MKTIRRFAAMLTFVATSLASPILTAQTAAPSSTPLAQFDAATIKHHNPNDSNPYSNAQGFYGSAGGRIFAIRLSRYLNLPVLNQTGIGGSWDFRLPVDPESQDTVAQVLDLVNGLGLKIKRGRGPIQTLVIDRIDHPILN